MQFAERFPNVALYGDSQPQGPFVAVGGTVVGSDYRASTTKRHAACDECRTRKLKCSGEPTGCARCRKQQIACQYSNQKQMGRPRKRQRTDEAYDALQDTQTTANETFMDAPIIQQGKQDPPYLDASSESMLDKIELPIDPSLAAASREQASFTNICNGPIAQSIRDSRDSTASIQQMAHYQSYRNNNNNNNIQEDAQPEPRLLHNQYPLDISSWPDFSTIESLPVPMQTSEPTSSSYSSPYNFDSADGTYYDADADPAALQALPAVPSCPCLPNLYLTLSTLSATSAYPVTSHTVQTLLSAHKTAHSVIYCPICPQKYQSGSQNLMLGCTLLNVLADHWRRARVCPAGDLKKGFARQNSLRTAGQAESFVSVKEGQAWRRFSHDLIQACVFGRNAIPQPPSKDTEDTHVSSAQSSSDTTLPQPTTKLLPQTQTLHFLIDALRRRQRQWHHFDDPTDEFPDCSGAFTDYKHAHSHHPHHRRRKTPQSNQDSSDTDGGAEQQMDHAVCLMLVNHCMDMIKALDDDGDP